MKAVMYGGGNIGRGFIGTLLSGSGYEVTFIDVAKPVVNALREKRTYPVRYVSAEGYEDVWVENVTAVDGNDAQVVADAIAACDIMATAVGARVLKFIVPNIVAGLRKRWAAGGGPLNIIICENIMDANRVLEEMLKAHLTEEEQWLLDETVGLVETSIGRMVPVQTEEMKDGEPLRVCVERYGFLPVDKAAFKGEIPQISGMIPYEPFDFYIKRKLYIHNMGHATCAYLGDLLGLEYIYQAIAVPEIRMLVQNAMQESAMALSQRYGVELRSLQNHITDLLHRFANSALKDTCARVGGDPARKLSYEDRLIGAARVAEEEGFCPASVAVGAAAGIYRYIEENQMTQSVKTAGQVLREVSQIGSETELAKLILQMYRLILDGASVMELCLGADRAKLNRLGAVI